jgi:hypothetical protein
MLLLAFSMSYVSHLSWIGASGSVEGSTRPLDYFNVLLL